MLSWTDCAAYSLKTWAQKYGIFVPLEKFYLSITFLEPNKVDGCYSGERRAQQVDMTQRSCEHPPRRTLLDEGLRRSVHRTTSVAKS